MLRFVFITLLLIGLFSCKEKKSNTQLVETETESLSVDTPENSTQLVRLTPELIEKNRLEEWTHFLKFKDAMEDMSKLNPAGIIIFLSELNQITTDLIKAPFPENYDKLPIYGRIKVVHTLVIKCHFYAVNQQNEKLNRALEELYFEYNVLLKRMISMAEENKIPLDSLGMDEPTTFQGSKMRPTLSKK
jgi:hypothetical protein